MLTDAPIVLANMDEPVAIIFAGFLFSFLCFVVHSRRKSKERREIEQSRREVAAYVAEGSMSPDEAARLLAADPVGAQACVPPWARYAERHSPARA
jgi:hypothetical protein